MSQEISLGLQAPGTAITLLSAHGSPPRGVLRRQTPPQFPSPGRRFRVVASILILALTGGAALALGILTDNRATWAALLVPVVLGLGAVFIGGAVRTARDRRGRFSASGTVIMSDHAGIVDGDDAQQRVLIHVEHEGTVQWLAATQGRLYLAEGDEVRVSWASPNSESCYVHETIASSEPSSVTGTEPGTDPSSEPRG